MQSDGSLYVSTPVDPLFILLPYLMKEKSVGGPLLMSVFSCMAWGDGELSVLFFFPQKAWRFLDRPFLFGAHPVIFDEKGHDS